MTWVILPYPTHLTNHSDMFLANFSSGIVFTGLYHLKSISLLPFHHSRQCLHKLLSAISKFSYTYSHLTLQINIILVTAHSGLITTARTPDSFCFNPLPSFITVLKETNFSAYYVFFFPPNSTLPSQPFMTYPNFPIILLPAPLTPFHTISAPSPCGLDFQCFYYTLHIHTMNNHGHFTHLFYSHIYSKTLTVLSIFSPYCLNVFINSLHTSQQLFFNTTYF